MLLPLSQQTLAIVLDTKLMSMVEWLLTSAPAEVVDRPCAPEPQGKGFLLLTEHLISALKWWWILGRSVSCPPNRQQTSVTAMQDPSPEWASYFLLVAGSFYFYSTSEVGNLCMDFFFIPFLSSNNSKWDNFLLFVKSAACECAPFLSRMSFFTFISYCVHSWAAIFFHITEDIIPVFRHLLLLLRNQMSA